MTDKNIDQAKGRVKEAAGALTGDRGLKKRGTRRPGEGVTEESRRPGRRDGKGTHPKQRARVAMDAPTRSRIGR